MPANTTSVNVSRTAMAAGTDSSGGRVSSSSTPGLGRWSICIRSELPLLRLTGSLSLFDAGAGYRRGGRLDEDRASAEQLLERQQHRALGMHFDAFGARGSRGFHARDVRQVGFGGHLGLGRSKDDSIGRVPHGG